MEDNVDRSSDLAKLVQKKRVVDRISALPDEVIELILSKLKLRDAIRTGVLSCRWKNMWEYINGTLDFDIYFDIDFVFDDESESYVRTDKARFISAVNSVLNAHKGLTVEALNVRYDLDIRHKLGIDSWINSALRKKVRRLKLDFTQPHFDEFPQDFEAPYEFPLPLLEKSNVSCLTSLSLYCVKITNEVLNYLLLNCPFLESLCVEHLSSDTGVHLAPCPMLKHLDIGAWSEVFDISSAPNLTTFVYSGSKKTRFSIKNVPNLTRVSLGGSYCKAIIKKSRELPSFLFQLKNLTLELQAATMTFPEFPKFPKLNNISELKLTFIFDDYDEESDIFSCTSLMEACPNLYRFSIELTWGAKIMKVHNREKWSFTNKCLKVVELEGFGGTRMELEFYKCLLSSAPSLNKIIVGISRIFNDKKTQADESVRRLTQQLSPCAELVMKLSHSFGDEY